MWVREIFKFVTDARHGVKLDHEFDFVGKAVKY